ncbi:pimeloyl-ACP methyl ester carboxylesterase [Sphingobium boeckii]|uniref:Pimeloyl-ACP methyl ester carboxylesterase n=2 Tax=Sphingobium boeckii TaxID=1082345 RepID=A0A7W9AIH0_9SPHN|nr:pimeloyl-ACP methyl ester carboxylesterase [Sphingobium boeckii]
MSGRVFEAFIAEMGEDRLAVAPDTPGFGMSDAPEQPPEIMDYARAMAALVDALDIDGPIDLMGYHTGTRIACELARLRPQQVRRLVLVAAAIMTAEERDAQRKLYEPVKPSLDGTHLSNEWQSYVHFNLGRGLDLNAVADMFPEMLLGRDRAWYGHHAAFNHALDQTLAALRQPVMVINPADDLQLFTSRAAPLLSNGCVIDKPEWGHGFLDASTQDAARIVRAFLDSSDEAPFSGV